VRASTYPLIDAVEAHGIVLRSTPVLPVEEVALSSAAGRVLAEPLLAGHDLPAWPSSAVD